MTRISRRFLDKSIEERICDVFCQHLATLSTKEDVREFFVSLLSSTEQIMIPKRLAIAVLLQKGFTFDDIDDRLKVSKGTITTIQRQLHTGAIGYQKAINSIKKRKQNEELWDSLEELLLKISMPARYGSVRHQIKSQIGKELYRREKQRSVI
jgi:uncharacterized protein YerC